MPKCLSCGCEINESNDSIDALYRGGYCNSCSEAEEHRSKEDAELYDTYISTLCTPEEKVEPQEPGDEEERSEYEALYSNDDPEEDD